MDLIEAHQKVQQVENGLKLALIIVGGISGVIGLALLIAASQVKKIAEEEPVVS